MKYFVVETALVNGSYANSLFVKDTLTEAKKEYHNFLGYQIDCTGVSYTMCAILDENGNVIEHESWRAESEVHNV